MEAARLNPDIHQPVRLQILAVLHKNRQASFIDLRDGLGLTPGNLSSHVKRLEALGFVVATRVLAGLRFEVVYRITQVGSAAFVAYLDELSAFLHALDPTAPVATVPTGAEALSGEDSETRRQASALPHA